MTWIRWDTAAPRSDVVGWLAERLHIPLAQALGHYLAVCCGFGESKPDGNVSEVGDATLEQWALWRDGNRGGRKAGLFAAAFRERCCDESGYLRGWWRQEKLLAKRERDAGKRKPPKDPPFTPEKPARNPLTTLAANERTNGTNKKIAAPDGANGAPPNWVAAIQAELIQVGACTFGQVGKLLRDLYAFHGDRLIDAARAYRETRLADGVAATKYGKKIVAADFADRAGVFVEHVTPGSAARDPEFSRP